VLSRHYPTLTAPKKRASTAKSRKRIKSMIKKNKQLREHIAGAEEEDFGNTAMLEHTASNPEVGEDISHLGLT
jgi:hypothetical protein